MMLPHDLLVAHLDDVVDAVGRLGVADGEAGEDELLARRDRRQVELVDHLTDPLARHVGVLVDRPVHPAVDHGGAGAGVDARELVERLGLAEQVGEVEDGGAGRGWLLAPHD